MECKYLGITIGEQVFRIGDEVTLYFVDLGEKGEGVRRTRDIIAKSFRIHGFYPAVITLEDQMGFKTSFSYWEFKKRLKPPKKIKDARNNNVFIFEGGSLV